MSSSPSTQELTTGTRIVYNVGANETIGTIKSVITSDAEAVQHIHASREHPRFLIENAHTGHEALVSEPSIRAVLMPLPEKKK